MNRLKFLASIILIYASICCKAQTYSSTAALVTETHCSQPVPLSFTQQNQFHDIHISLNAETKLSVTIQPSGEYLRVWTEILDPGGSVIYPPVASRNILPAKGGSQTFTTGSLDATGSYTIRVYNFCRYHGGCYQASHVGDYSLTPTCISKVKDE